MSTSVIERYRDRLPVSPATPVVSLGEGSTPLVSAPALSRELGVELFLKLESMNPTASFKDRGMTVAVSKALEEGAKAVICASTGNTAASAAAYAARAGLEAIILQPAGAVALGKLAQARAVGATVLEIRGSFDEALDAARELADRGTHALVNSLNPYRLQGQKTVAFELVDELGELPDLICLPYGGGGNTRALGLGLEELASGVPRIYAAQAAERARTVASAIRIADPVHRAEAEQVIARSEGSVVTVSDDEILIAWRALAREEGIFCEPAGAVALVGAAEAVRLGEISKADQVVCLVTGSGFKDINSVESMISGREATMLDNFSQFVERV
jgi:threonine synthase